MSLFVLSAFPLRVFKDDRGVVIFFFAEALFAFLAELYFRNEFGLSAPSTLPRAAGDCNGCAIPAPSLHSESEGEERAGEKGEDEDCWLSAADSSWSDSSWL